jgi:hypothetical protein
MSSTITGNVGGSSFSGAIVQMVNVLTKVIKFTVADASGNYSITTDHAGSHIISASGIASYSYPTSMQVIVDNTSSYSAVNLTPVAL